jgi:hypothetical protein
MVIAAMAFNLVRAAGALASLGSRLGEPNPVGLIGFKVGHGDDWQPCGPDSVTIFRIFG